MSALSPILRRVEGGRLMFRCPGCASQHMIRVDGDGGGPRWQWDGNADAPTFAPSILVTWDEGEPPQPRVCHSFVRRGQIEFLGDCTHALAGKTVPIPAWNREPAFTSSTLGQG